MADPPSNRSTVPDARFALQQLFHTILQHRTRCPAVSHADAELLRPSQEVGYTGVPDGALVQVDWRHTLTEGDAALESLRNGNTRFY